MPTFPFQKVFATNGRRHCKGTDEGGYCGCDGDGDGDGDAFGHSTYNAKYTIEHCVFYRI